MDSKNNESIFTPLDLNEQNVDKIFAACLATNEEASNNNLIVPIMVLLPELTKKSSPPVFFSKEKYNLNRDNIRFLFGQLHSSHTNSDITLPSGIAKYDGTAWTRSSSELFKLYSMSMAIGRMSPFVLVGNQIISKKSPALYLPTISPNDPRFEKWFKEYKANMHKLGGQEPEEH